MADFLSNGVSALLAFQRAIDTTSHNIANVGTDGYSRQRAEFVTRQPDMKGNGWIGSGVDVATTRRVYDDLLAQQVRITTSSFNSLDAFSTQVDRINNLFGSATTGLSASMQKFANAVQDVANTPASSSARQVLLSEAQGLAQRLQSYDSQLAGFGTQAETQIKSETNEITTLASGIADLNQKIALASKLNGQPPNDLLDQRDRLIDQLSGHIDVNTVAQGDGQLNVFIGTGQPLVVGGEAASISTIADPYDPSRQNIALKTGSGVPVDITKNVTGGTLGGLLDFRTQVLDPTRNALGHLAVGLADAINTQHRAGMDLSGNMGGDLFTLGSVDTLRSAANTGSGALSVTRSDVSALTEADYHLQKTATGWALTRDDTGAAVTLAGAGTVASPFTADGLSIVVSGTAATGDRFLIRPTRNAAAGIGVVITDPSRVAAAAPIRAEAAAANTGSGAISAGTVIDATNAQLRSPVTLQFLSASTYSVNGGPAIAYTPGSPISVNGWQVGITGAPATGDIFTVKDNAGGTGDNRNALALANALGQGTLDGGTTSVNDLATGLVGKVGVAARQAQAGRDAQSVVKQESIDSREAVSGVNLDEEAANLIKFQQAYQAAAQMIKTASDMFDSLLAATRR
jgi:flagellar hook-associated protein 1